MEKKKFIIIGGVAAGMSAASKIRTLDTAAQIQVFQKSGYVSYGSCGIPYLIEGKISSSNKLITYDAGFFKEKRNIDVALHHEVVKIFPSTKTVLVRNLMSGEESEILYHKLLISTGARPILPPIKGITLKGIFSVRLLEDGIAIQDYLSSKSARRCLIIGAGNIGMEMAEAFSERGLIVTIVEKMPNILGSMDDEINQIVEEELSSQKVILIKSKSIVELIGDESGVKHAVLEDGTIIDTDIVIVGTGIKPNTEIAREAGIKLGETGAVKVDNRMQTNISDIYSAGDCAEVFHLIFGRNVYLPLGTTANKQGRIAGENMAGKDARFAGVVGTSVFKVFGLEVGRTGLTERDAGREGNEYIATVIDQLSRAHYYPGVTQIRVKLIADEKTNQILGAQMVGREGVSKRLDIFATALSAKLSVNDINNLDLGYAPPFAPVYDPVLIAASELLKKTVVNY